MSDAMITVENLGKSYRLRHQGEKQRYTALRDVLAEKFKGIIRGFKGGDRDRTKPARGTSYEEFWALREVSFEIKRGDVVGIIGRNGAGKSTLLKVLSRITEPTTGRVHLKGRVASLLEVGTGFHPELTGRENVFLNGAILGMNRLEIKRKFDEIVAFAEVEKFLDTPVKRYSSGMYVRLAFAVAAHLEPDILIVDEVLAVGDVEFQKKCLGKMQDVATGGRTVLFVSHNMAAISRLCQKGLFMRQGRVVTQGSVEAVVAQYLQSASGEKSMYTPQPGQKQPGNDFIRLNSVSVQDINGFAGPVFGGGETLVVEVVYEILKSTRGLRVGFYLHSADGTIVFNGIDTDALAEERDSQRSQQPGQFRSWCQIPAGFLNRGQYTLTVGSDTPAGVNFYCENLVSFFVEPDGRHGTHMDNRAGLICPDLQWKIQRLPVRA
jgi:lipopolysaccharide transport system ATP-binding protein